MIASPPDDVDFWKAVGVLAAADDITIDEACLAVCECALCLGVGEVDVAAFVLWNGTLPS